MGFMTCHPEGTEQTSEVGLIKTHKVQQGQEQGPTRGVGQSPVTVQAGQ